MKTKTKPPTNSERLTRRQESKQKYWQKFKTNRKRVYGSLTHAQHAALEHRAKTHKRSLWDQVWAESEAYRNQTFLPTPLIEKELAALTQILRGVAGNINQMARYSHWIRQAYDKHKVIERLGELERLVTRFLKHPGFSKDSD